MGPEPKGQQEAGTVAGHCAQGVPHGPDHPLTS